MTRDELPTWAQFPESIPHACQQSLSFSDVPVLLNSLIQSMAHGKWVVGLDKNHHLAQYPLEARKTCRCCRFQAEQFYLFEGTSFVE
jgi:hypothetical protein